MPQETQPELRDVLLEIARERATIEKCQEHFALDREDREDVAEALAELDALERTIWVGHHQFEQFLEQLKARGALPENREA